VATRQCPDDPWLDPEEFRSDECWPPMNFFIAFPHAADLFAPLKYKHPPLF
jgi:hypothetical protein